MWIVWWGTHQPAVERGSVWDACSACQCIQRFSLVDHFDVSHVYTVFQSRPVYRGSSRHCSHCGYQVMVNPQAYSAFLPAAATHELGVHEGVRRTNAALDAAFQGVAAGKEAAAAVSYRRDADEQELPLAHAVEWLEWMLFAGHYVHPLAAALQRWTAMSSTDKQQLIASAESAVRNIGGTWSPAESERPSPAANELHPQF